MVVELVPVIEIGYNNQGIPVPDKYPYWKNVEVGDKYHQDSYHKAGFKDILKPYLGGSTFYRLNDISKDNLTKLIEDHTEDLRAGLYGREQVSALFGGYVLRIDGEDIFFPQCCGDLSDIVFWEQIANGNQKAYYEGHPAPEVKVNNHVIIFDFSVEEYDEPFVPELPSKILEVDREALLKAVEDAKLELSIFAERLNGINTTQQLDIEAIDTLLIWTHPNQT